MAQRKLSGRLKVQGLEISVRVASRRDGVPIIEVSNFPGIAQDNESQGRRDFVSAFQRELERVKSRK